MLKKLFLSLCSLFCLTSATHIGPSYDTKPRYAMDKLGAELAKKYQLEFLSSGIGVVADAKKAIWALNFVCKQAMTIEQATPVAQDIAAQMLKLMYEDPLFANYFIEGHQPQYTLNDDLMAFRLAFWDQNVNRPLSPHLAQICLRESHLYFYYADPKTQALLDNPVIIPLAKTPSIMLEK